jgi:hypothetical protein
MTMRTLKRGLNHAVLTLMFIGSLLSIHAAEVQTAVNTFSNEADKWGLWPVLAISVVGASMAYAWALSRRNDTLVDKIIKYHETVLLDSQKVSGKLIGEVYMLRNAIRDARCGKNLPDSDGPENTPSRGEQVAKRRQDRQERRSDT